jgi:hypothetical protein
MNKSLLEPAVKLFRYLRPDFVCPTWSWSVTSGVVARERTSSCLWSNRYFFEQDLGYPVTSIDTGDLGRADLSQFDVLVTPDGYYGSLFNDSTLDKVKTFVMRSGGKVVCLSRERFCR